MAHIPKPQGPHNNMGMLTVAYHVGLHGATQKNMGCLCINGLNVSTNTFGTGWWHDMGKVGSCTCCQYLVMTPLAFRHFAIMLAIQLTYLLTFLGNILAHSP
jgi:hypothetical protein